jgi:ABC-2 type transport system permease protein
VTALTGTGPLLRLALRRDRVVLTAWVAVLVLSVTSSAAATVDLYPTESSRVTAARGINSSSSLVALYGRIYDPTSLGAVSLIKMIAFGSAMVALLAITLVVRHTRAEEENGRLELVGATVVGRQAALTAAVAGVSAAMVALGLLAAGALVLTGLPLDGSLVFGAAWAGNGIAFAAVAALTAQLTTSARAATGLATAVLGVSYLLRAIGDASGGRGAGWLSWLSPVGWAQQLRPFAGNRWAVVLLTALFAAATTAAAFVLSARRDHGAGLLADRPGPPEGRLGSAWGLAWRLQRWSLLGWTAGFVVLGGVIGGLATTVGDLLDSAQAQDWIRRLGGQQALTDAFLATELGFAGVIATAFGIQAVNRLRAEETALRAEPVLGTAVSRTRWVASHLAVGLAGSAWLLLATGLVAGVAYGATTDDVPGETGRLVTAALAQVPAVWLVVGIALAAFGLAPRLGPFGWAVLVGFLLLGELGPVLGLPQPVMDLSPYAHSPRLPGAHPALGALPVLGVVAVLLLGSGIAGFRRRDVG